MAAVTSYENALSGPIQLKAKLKAGIGFLLSAAFADRPANVCGKGTFIVTHSCFKQQ